MFFTPDCVATALLSTVALQPDVLWALRMLPVAYVAAVTVPLAVFDVRHRRLPNVLVLPGIGVVAFSAVLSALLLNVELHPSAPSDPTDSNGARAAPETAGGALIAVLATLLAFGAARALGVLGMGDVKLAVLLVGALAPVAFRSPPCAAFWLIALAFAATTVSAGIAATVLLAHAWCAGASRPRGIPLGPFLLLGFWLAFAAALLLPP